MSQGESLFFLQIIYETVPDICSQTLTVGFRYIEGTDENYENKMMVLFSLQQNFKLL